MRKTWTPLHASGGRGGFPRSHTRGPAHSRAGCLLCGIKASLCPSSVRAPEPVLTPRRRHERAVACDLMFVPAWVLPFYLSLFPPFYLFIFPFPFAPTLLGLKLLPDDDPYQEAAFISTDNFERGTINPQTWFLHGIATLDRAGASPYHPWELGHARWVRQPMHDPSMHESPTANSTVLTSLYSAVLGEE